MGPRLIAVTSACDVIVPDQIINIHLWKWLLMISLTTFYAGKLRI